MAIRMRMDGRTEDYFMVKRPEDGIEKYLSEREMFFTRINDKCVAAGREPQFDDVKLAARTFDVIPMENGGFKLVKRSNPLMGVDDDLDGHNIIVAQMAKTIGEQTGAAKMRGKYNDGALLLDQNANYSISEVQDFVAGE